MHAGRIPSTSIQATLRRTAAESPFQPGSIFCESFSEATFYTEIPALIAPRCALGGRIRSVTDRFSLESFRCASRHPTGWIRDRVASDSPCLVIATSGVWMERAPRSAPVTVDAQTVSYRAGQPDLWVQHSTDNHDSVEVIRLRRALDVPQALQATTHATARMSMDCLLAHADVIAARSRAMPQPEITLRLERLVALVVDDLTQSLRRPHHFSPSHVRLAERVRFDSGTAASRSHTSRVFRQVNGMTLSHYRQRSRIADAIRRIASSDDKFACIAVDSGFADHAHLSRSVALATGLTPTSLRARFISAKAT